MNEHITGEALSALSNADFATLGLVAIAPRAIIRARISALTAEVNEETFLITSSSELPPPFIIPWERGPKGGDGYFVWQI